VGSLDDVNSTSSDDNALVELADGTTVGSSKPRQKVGSDNRAWVDADFSNAVNFPHINRIDVSSSGRTTSGDSGSLDTDGMGMINSYIDVTAVSGTNPTLDIFAEASDDNSDWFPFIQSQRFTTTGNKRFQGIRIAGKYYRYRWVIAGTTPSFTFSITTTLKAYLPRRFSNKIQYGFDLTQSVNSVSETFRSDDSQNVSLVTIRAVDGGSGAQYKVQVSNDDINWVTITNAIAQNSPSENANTFQGAYRFYRLILTASSNPGVRTMDIFWACNS